MADTFFTIGHSTRSVAELVDLLRESGIQALVDIRTVPRSRTNPQFNREVLPSSLAPEGIAYEHVAELGGLRGKQRALEASPNLFWANTSFRNYADYALSDTSSAGLARLLEIGGAKPTAVMCAEAVWWRCHRRIVADYLIVAGCRVFHILGAGSVQPAALTPAARPVAEGLVYPAPPEPADDARQADAAREDVCRG